MVNYHIGGKLGKFSPGQWLCKEERSQRCAMFQRPARCWTANCPFFIRSRIAEPEETYIHALGTFGIDGIGCKSFCYCVIDHYGSGLPATYRGYPSSWRIFLNLAALWAFWIAAPNSASATSYIPCMEHYCMHCWVMSVWLQLQHTLPPPFFIS